MFLIFGGVLIIIFLVDFDCDRLSKSTNRKFYKEKNFEIALG
jgi:hypothetical protein